MHVQLGNNVGILFKSNEYHLLDKLYDNLSHTIIKHLLKT